MLRPRATDLSSPIISEEGTRDSGWIVGKQEVIRFLVTLLSLARMLSGANAFEISDTQEDENKAALIRRSECNNVSLR